MATDWQALEEAEDHAHFMAELFDWVNWCNNCRLHSTLGYMTPAGFREAGLILS